MNATNNLSEYHGANYEYYHRYRGQYDSDASGIIVLISFCSLLGNNYTVCHCGQSLKDYYDTTSLVKSSFFAFYLYQA